MFEDTTGRIRSHISKIPQGESEAIYLRYHRENQKIPQGESEAIYLRYHRENQKIPQGESADTTGRIRSHISKISQGESEAIYLRYHRENQKSYIEECQPFE